MKRPRGGHEHDSVSELRTLRRENSRAYTPSRSRSRSPAGTSPRRGSRSPYIEQQNNRRSAHEFRNPYLRIRRYCTGCGSPDDILCENK